jgi:hypothetical protein
LQAQGSGLGAVDPEAYNATVEVTRRPPDLRLPPSTIGQQASGEEISRAASNSKETTTWDPWIVGRM